MIYFAHSKENQGKSEWQLLKDHLENVCALSHSFASAFGAQHFGRAAGLLHDIGKYSPEFQRRLEGDRLHVDHSTAGAQEAEKLYGKALGRILAYVIAGHHSGLPDCGSIADESSLLSRLEKASLPEYSAYKNEITSLPSNKDMGFPIHPVPDNYGFSIQFFIRFLYSCLVDADFLDTEAALNYQNAMLRGNYIPLKEMQISFDAYMDKKTSNAEVTIINRLRSEILASCREKAALDPGFFTLTVPTGGGKTLSSLAFALKHAILHNMERVIYVIPFTSIIEQNAAVFKDIVGYENVLEHHSSFQYDSNQDEDGDEVKNEIIKRFKLSTENWDAPIVATTNIQFFESLFASRSSKCRKLHNIAKSVVILDEAQMIPTAFLKPCLYALYELTANYGTSIVLCTATQPALKDLLPSGVKITEVAPNPEHLYEVFRRVTVSDIGELDDNSLAERLLKHDQVLCIVNTRNHAYQLHDLLKDNDRVYHLSARMCPAHRTMKLKQIRETLKNKEICRVISTQLIEAGVDVDFPVVYRCSAGIDSIAQAAGRCNREGHLSSGEVFVFRSKSHELPKGWFSRTASVADIVLRKYGDPLSMEAINSYFSILYDLEGQSLDEKNIMERFEEGARSLAFPFKEVAKDFKLINTDLIPIIIPWDNKCRELIRKASYMDFPGSLGRLLQPYVVQVYPYEFNELVKLGAIKTVAEYYNILIDETLYSDRTGLEVTKNVSKAGDILII